MSLVVRRYHMFSFLTSPHTPRSSPDGSTNKLTPLLISRRRHNAAGRHAAHYITPKKPLFDACRISPHKELTAIPSSRFLPPTLLMHIFSSVLFFCNTCVQRVITAIAVLLKPPFDAAECVDTGASRFLAGGFRPMGIASGDADRPFAFIARQCYENAVDASSKSPISRAPACRSNLVISHRRHVEELRHFSIAF